MCVEAGRAPFSWRMPRGAGGLVLSVQNQVYSVMRNRLLFAFKPFPRKEKSPEAVATRYALTRVVRGNVYARIGGIISVEDHTALIKQAKDIDLAKID